MFSTWWYFTKCFIAHQKIEIDILLDTFFLCA